MTSESLKYPRGAIYILVGYFLERFVYYGLFGGAVFYMQRMLGFDSSSAKTAKAVLEGLIYLAPIAGAVLADTYLGKARTVFLMCVGYTVGTVIYTASSVTPIMSSVTVAKGTGVLGLLVLGMCAGLMKAVYSSLGADQFKIPEQRRHQERFFYFFYWMINAGAFLGMFMTAQLRDTVQCFKDDCYFLPYIILVGLMALSTIIFAAGRSRYTESPPDPMLLRALRCVFHALKKSRGPDRKPVDHWLDRARDQYEPGLLRDVKTTLRVLLLFCTFPVFWALFYQTSTGMIFQAKRLDGRLGQDYRIPPEMSSTANPLLILTLIPLFDLVIYPILDRLGLLREATSRMIAGMCFAVCSFLVYAAVNRGVEQDFIPSGFARLHAYNALPCEAALLHPEGRVDAGGQVALEVEVLGAEVEVRVNASCLGEVVKMAPVEGGRETTLLIGPGGLHAFPPTLEYLKDVDAEAKVRVLAPGEDSLNVTLRYDALEVHLQASNGSSPFERLSPKDYTVLVGNAELGEAHVRQDGVYDLVVGQGVLVFPMTAPSDLHILWLLPQYLLLTVGEVLFSVSGMDFAYSQAPEAMRSTLQAANLFTITVGLWLFAGLTGLRAFEHRPSHEALLYAALMALDAAIFVGLLRWYHRRSPQVEGPAQNVDQERSPRTESTTHDNKAYKDDQSV